MEASLVTVKKVDRKLFLCLEHQCSKCGVPVISVPDDCPYLILHALETRKDGIKWMERRSGKTTALIGMANRMARIGCPVYFVTKFFDSKIHISDRLDPGVLAMAESEAQRKMRGLASGFVFCDELRPNSVECILDGGRSRSKLVAAYYS